MEDNNVEIIDNKLTLSKEIDMDVDYQENLMSYNDDMLKIIRCNIDNFIVNSDFKDNKLIIYGKSKIYLTYISENKSSFTTAEFEEDFQKEVNVDEKFIDLITNISVVNKYCSYRVINQRRIDIHNSFKLNLNGICQNKINMINNVDNVLIKHDKISCLSIAGMTNSKVEFDEEVSIPTDSLSIRKIINCFSNCYVEEIKVIKDKMLIKFYLTFSFLYTLDDENESIKRCQKSFSVSKIVDLIGIDNGDFPFVEYQICNLYFKPKTNKNNELKLIDLIGQINLNVTVYKKSEFEIACDCYSTECEVENNFENIIVNEDFTTKQDIISDEAVFEFDNVKIKEILDLSFDIIDFKTVELNAYIINDNSECIFISKRQEINIFNYNVCSLSLKSFDYIIKSEKSITVNYTLNYSVINYKTKSYNVLTNIEFQDKEIPDTPTLIVYFTNENETVWDIAKKFRSSTELIKKENNLKDDVIKSKKILFIPGV